MPKNNTLDEVIDNLKWYPFFADCIGVLDGSHVLISVPSHKQSAWRNRKGWLLQNVLAACDFDMNFVYILPGWEGSAHDGRVLGCAKD